MTRSWLRHSALLLAGLSIATVACGGDDEASDAAVPRADLIDPAIAAIEAERGPIELLEVSANLDGVDAIVRDGDSTDAVLYRYDGTDLTGPIEPRTDDRDTFTPDQIDIEPDRLFDELLSELDDVALIDFAIHVDGGVLVNDATAASPKGGVLLVLLSGDGQVVGVQAA